MKSQFLRLFAAVAWLFVVAAPALAQNNITIENVSARDESAKTVVVFNRIDVANTNLSRDEVLKLFSGDIPLADAAAMAGRMKADRLTISGATLVSDDGKVVLGPFEATGLDHGRFGRAVLAEASFNFSDKAGGGGSLSARKLQLESGNIAPLILAMQTKDFDAAAFQIGRVVWDGFDGSFVDADTPADAPGGNLIKIRLQGLAADTEFRDDLPLRSKVQAVGFVLDPAPASAFGKGLRAFGYERLEFGLSGAGRYDPATKRLVLENHTITSPDAGRLSLSGEMSGVDAPALSSSDATQRGVALLGASLEGVRIEFVNEGLVEKGFAYAAAQQGKSAAGLRKEASTMAAQLLPLLLGGDPQSLALAQSVQTFLSAPKNFLLTLKARGAPVPLARLGAIRDPQTFLALVEVNLQANQ